MLLMEEVHQQASQIKALKDEKEQLTALVQFVQTQLAEKEALCDSLQLQIQASYCSFGVDFLVGVAIPYI
jgi:hypothetical protein